MLWLYPEQLILELKNKIKSVYILLGNDLFLLQSSHVNILNKIQRSRDIDHIRVRSNTNFNWNQVFELCKKNNLFSKKKILSLQFPKDYSITNFNKNIPLLSSLIHDNLILILLIYISQNKKQHFAWIQLFNKIGIVINCNKPDHKRLELWIHNQSKNMKLNIENLACQLLCYYYENNTMLLYQTLQQLSLIYPDGYISFIRVKNIVTDSACFNVNHWIESILVGKKKRASRILKQLEYTYINLKKLLNKIQKEILILLQIKYYLLQEYSLHTLFNKYNIYTQYHRIILSRAANRLNLEQLYQSISLLTIMEIKYYQNYTYLSKTDFELLIEILCNPKYNAILEHM